MASPKIVLITGGNNGIGYEAVKALLQSKIPYHVIMGSRSLDKAHTAIQKLHDECPASVSTVTPIQVDITSDKSIERAFEQVQKSHGHLDVLINNAGAAFDPAFQAKQLSLRSSFTNAYNVNVAGTHVLTWTFIPLLLKSTDPRLIFVAGLSQITVAAEAYFPTPAQPAGWPKTNIGLETIGYRCSKVALNMLMLDWNHKLKADGVKVWSVGPGFLETDLGGMREKGREMGAGHASAGGEILRRVVEGERDGDVGRIVSREGFSAW